MSFYLVLSSTVFIAQGHIFKSLSIGHNKRACVSIYELIQGLSFKIKYLKYLQNKGRTLWSLVQDGS